MKKIMLVLLVLIAVILAGCQQQTPTTATTPTQAEKGFDGVIYIGFSGPLSGGAALYGQNNLQGLQFAVEDINNAGGVDIAGKKYRLEVVSVDDKYSPALTVPNAEKLFETYKTPVIFCPHSGGVLAMEKFNEERGFIIGAYTSSPAILEGGNKHIFQIPPNFEVVYVPFLSNVFLDKGIKRAATMEGTHEYGVLWGEKFKEYWKSKGGEIVAEAPINYYTETDYTTHLQKVLAANPEVILVVGPSEPIANLIKTARDMGYTGGFLVAEQAKIEEIMYFLGIEYDFTTKTVKKGDLSLLEKTAGTSAPEALVKLPSVVDFKLNMVVEQDPLLEGYKITVERIKARIGDYPVTWEHALEYQAMMVLAKAIDEADSLDPDAIMDALENKVWPADGYMGIPAYIYSKLMRTAPYGTVGSLNTPGSALVIWDGELTGYIEITPQFWGQEYKYVDAQGNEITW